MAFTYRNSAYLLDHWIVYTHQIHAFIDFPEDGDLSGFITSYVCVFFAMSRFRMRDHAYLGRTKSSRRRAVEYSDDGDASCRKGLSIME